MLRIQAAIDLLASAGFDVSPLQAPVAARQQQIEVELPMAVAEWYSIPSAEELIATHSDDDLVRLDTLGDPIPFWPDTTELEFFGRDFLRESLLFLGSENQGVVFWAVPVDEGPDPRVLVDLSPPDGAWTTHASSFSDYTEALVWDLLMFGHRFRAEPKDGAAEPWHGVAAQDTPLDQDELATLRARFTERPRTHGWPTPTTYRFERPGHKVLIWAGDEQADWWIFADTPGHLNDLVGELWEFGDLATNLYGVAGVGEALLQCRRNDPEATSGGGGQVA